MDTTETIKVNFVADAKGLKTAIAQVDKELAKLVVRTDQAQRVLGNGLGKASTQAVAGLKRTAKATQNATTAINQYSVAQNRSMKMSGQLRANIQNVGYQMADVAVQAEMGTNAFRILGQQGSQILGIFGPAGAIAGGFLAIGAAAIPALTGLGEKTKDLTKETDKLTESLAGMTEALEKSVSVKSGDGVLAQILSGKSILAISDAERALKSMSVAATGVLSSSGDTGWFDFQNMSDRMQEIQELQAEMQQNFNAGWTTATENLQARLVLVMKTFAGEFEMTYDAAVRLQTALESVGDIDLSSGPADLVASLSRIESQLRPVKDESDEMYQLWRNIVISLESARSELDAQTKAAQKYNIALYATNSTYGEMVRRQAQMTNKMITFATEANKASERFDNAKDAAAGMAVFTGTIATNTATILQNLRGMGSTVLGRFMGGYQGEVGRGGAGDPSSFENDPYWRGRFFPSPYEPTKPDKKPAGGGKSAAEKAQDDLEKSIRKTMKAMDEQIKLTQQWSDQWEESLGSGIGSALDGFVDGLVSGELAFKDFAKSVIADLGKIALKAMIAQIILSSIGLTPGMSAADASFLQRVVGGGLGFDFAAKGMALNKGAPIPFANGGVVNAPTMFPMTGGRTGLMGEAGPEAIMPLQRDASGSLGVAGVAPKIVVNNYSGQEVVVNQNQEIIEIAVGHSRKAVANDFSQSMASGQGTYARAMESSYNSRRKAT